MKTNKKLLRDGAIALGFGMLAGPALAQGTPGPNCDPLTGVCTTDGGGEGQEQEQRQGQFQGQEQNISIRDRLQAPGFGVGSAYAPSMSRGALPEGPVASCVTHIYDVARSSGSRGLSFSAPGFGAGIGGSSEGESGSELRTILAENNISYTEDAETGDITLYNLDQNVQGTVAFCTYLVRTDYRLLENFQTNMLEAQTAMETFLRTLKDLTREQRCNYNSQLAGRIGLTFTGSCTTPRDLEGGSSSTDINDGQPDDTAGLPTGYTNEFEKGHLCADGEGGLVEPSNGRFVNAETGREQTGEYCRRQLPGYRLD